jgi:hypothetical protein
MGGWIKELKIKDKPAISERIGYKYMFCKRQTSVVGIRP